MRNSLKSAVAGVLTLCIAGVISVAGASSAAAVVPPFDPDPDAYGTITFYDAAGNVVTSGDAKSSESPKYAVSSATPAGVINKYAAIALIGPRAGVPTGMWGGTLLNANRPYPITAAPAPVSASPFPASTMLAVSQSMFMASKTFETNTGALANVFQVRLISQGIESYASASITIDPITGLWQQVFPVPAPAATVTTTALGVTPASPATAPSNPTLTATVATGPPATPAAAGAVEFFDGTTSLGAPAAVAGGTATKALTGVAAGSHSYTAKFIPANPAAFTPSTSTAVAYQVNAALKLTPTVGLTSSSGTPTSGSSVTFSATITNPNAAGTVEFFDGTTSLAAATATNEAGVATYTTSALVVGTHSVSAKYLPTNTTANNPATSTAVTVNVSDVNPDDSKPVVTVTEKSEVVTSNTTAKFTYAGSDDSGANRTWTYLCSLDGTAYTACPSTKSYTGLTSARHTFRVKSVSPSGSESDPVSHTWTVDAVLPTVSLGALPAFNQSSSVVQAWAAKDDGAGVATTDVRWARATWAAGWSAWVYPTTWQGTTATKATVNMRRGYTYCLSARTRDKAGNTSAWSAPSCTSVPLDDQLMAASAGWARVTSGRFYVGTATATTRSNVTLTRTMVATKRIALVATRCPTCGTVGVYMNGILISKINLYAATTSRRSIVPVATFNALRSGTVSVRTLSSGKAVQIDGLGLSRI